MRKFLEFGMAQPKNCDPVEFVEFAIKNDFRWVEFKDELEMDPEGKMERYLAERLGAKLKKHGIGVSIHARRGGVNIAAVDPELLEKSRLAYKRSLHLGTLLGATYITVHSGSLALEGSQDPSEQSVTRLHNDTVNFLAEYTKAAHVHGITVSLENQYGFEERLKLRWMQRPEELLECRQRIFAQTGLHNSFTVDTGHMTALGYSPQEFIKLLGPEHVKLTHIHDNDGTADQHGIVGTGIIDFHAFLQAYLEEAWEFPWMFELGSLSKVKASRDYLEDMQLRRTS